jgi:Alw26I/Eco31I/Esp3I family type II restriction m6 adenine DNA methyltransferase
MSLYLKVLEDVRAGYLFKQNLLPPMEGNIKCGNSLIGSDYWDFVRAEQGKLFKKTEEEDRRVNPFDWDQEFADIIKYKPGTRDLADGYGFDAVIGNPPYDVLEKERRGKKKPHEYLRDYIKNVPYYGPALGGKLNLYRLFLIKSITLLKPNGQFGMILPLSLLADISCANARRYLMLNGDELLADCFPQKDDAKRRVFVNAKLSTTVITCKKTTKGVKKSGEITVRVFPGNSFQDDFSEVFIRLGDVKLLDPKNVPLPLIGRNDWEICKELYKRRSVIRFGDEPSIYIRRGEINQTIYRRFITDNPNMTKLLKGVELRQYGINKDLSQGKREWFDEDNYIKAGHANPLADEIRIATQRITGVDEQKRIVGTIIQPRTYFADSTNSISVSEDCKYSLGYLLGLLNSSLFQWRFKITSSNNNVGTNELEAMPLCTIDFSDPADVKKHDRMVDMVDEMLDLHKRLAAAKSDADRTRLERAVKTADRKIDALVYELYGLTAEEIRVVEGD